MAKITKDMTFQEVLQAHPQAAQVIAKNGLHCLGCHGALFESIEQGSKMHGFSDKQIKKMVEEMNAAVEEKKPAKKPKGKKID